MVRGASKFIYNSFTFFIRTNEYPDFGEERDEEAIKRRLKDIWDKSPEKEK